MPKEFDDCVRKVTAQRKKDGLSPDKARSSAFAICTASFKKAGKRFRANIDDMEKEEKKFDEEGREIIGENVKFYINAGINTIKE